MQCMAARQVDLGQALSASKQMNYGAHSRPPLRTAANHCAGNETLSDRSRHSLSWTQCHTWKGSLSLSAQSPSSYRACRVGSERRGASGVSRARAAEGITAQDNRGGGRVQGRGCRVVGTGSAVPSREIPNSFLAKVVDTSDEWISTRTGIRSRRVLSGEESMTQLGADACRKALAMAGVAAEDVDLIIFCTSSPDDIFGGACLVQRELQCTNAVAFDITAACSGFVLGLVTASRFIKGGGFQNCLVVGADALSRYVDWTDRGTCILFGDGCGAVVVRACADGEEDGLLGFDMKSDGQGARHLHALVGCSCAPAAPSEPPPHTSHGLPEAHTGVSSSLNGRPPPTPTPGEDGAALAGATVAVAEREAGGSGLLGAEASGGPHVQNGAGVAVAGAAAADASLELPGRAQPSFIAMNGREVYKFAVTAVPQVLRSALQEAQLEADQVDWLLLHQANQRILDAVAQKFGLPAEKVISNVANYGNTSAASIPLALDEAVRGGKVKAGDVIAMAGFGAGLTWAGAVVRYG